MALNKKVCDHCPANHECWAYQFDAEQYPGLCTNAAGMGSSEYSERETYHFVFQ
jgi:hypothetical protein